MVSAVNVKAAACQHIGDCAKMLWLHSSDGHSLPGNCAGDQKCTGLNPIGDHPVFGAVQFGYTLDNNPARSRALDLGAHLIQEVCQIDNLWLLSCAFNNCHTVSQNGSHHHV